MTDKSIKSKGRIISSKNISTDVNYLILTCNQFDYSKFSFGESITLINWLYEYDNMRYWIETKRREF